MGLARSERGANKVWVVFETFFNFYVNLSCKFVCNKRKRKGWESFPFLWVEYFKSIYADLGYKRWKCLQNKASQFLLWNSLQCGWRNGTGRSLSAASRLASSIRFHPLPENEISSAERLEKTSFNKKSRKYLKWSGWCCKKSQLGDGFSVRKYFCMQKLW